MTRKRLKSDVVKETIDRRVWYNSVSTIASPRWKFVASKTAKGLLAPSSRENRFLPGRLRSHHQGRRRIDCDVRGLARCGRFYFMSLSTGIMGPAELRTYCTPPPNANTLWTNLNIYFIS